MAILSICVLGNSNCSFAQEKPLVRQCGTMQVLEHTFENRPSLKAKFLKQTVEFQQSVNKRKTAGRVYRIEQNVIYVPVVFHIVLTNPAVITNAQIQAQLNVLNNDFAGMNSDSTNIPAAFKSLFGKSQIQFKLAQRTPDNESATGIVRVTTSHVVYSTFDKSLKYSTLDGDDAWDPDRFLNVWITNLSNGYVLGYSTLPGASVPAEEGIVIHYTTLPADSLTTFNRGRTLTHEAGHFFYLYHIWGDENGCTGTDFVDDTPNQTTLTSGCPGGALLTDGCSPVAPGILYENYMDYSDDACMCLFTNGQVTRMETALSDYHAGYFTSNGADPVPLFSLDAAVRKIIAPAQRVYTATISPVITLRNRGIEIVSSADFYASIDNEPAILTHYTGSLRSLDETTVTLNALTIATEGSHVLKVWVASPNGNADLNNANDTNTCTFQYYSKNINPNLLAKGFMVTPNPATDAITVQFYPNPSTLIVIVLYNSSGQKVAEQVAMNGTGNYIFNMSRFASGIYVVQAICSDKKLTQKVMKR